MLQIKNISKTYINGTNKTVALKGISINFPDKGMVFIVGKSGAGKSTLLNIIGGLDKMDDGEIIIDNHSTNDFSKNDFDAYRNYHIGFIFQEFNLIDDLTVKENIALALKIQAKKSDTTTIDEALKLVNLEGLGYRSPKELSGGQKQRIAVARALVKNPNIILADEPTGALDSNTGYEIMSSLKNLSKDKLVIVVTHDEEAAAFFADEIIKINDGNIIGHYVISKDYLAPKTEKIYDKIIKIPSGNNIDDEAIINNMLDKNQTNYVCLTSKPENITISYPESYNAVFKENDLSSKFVLSDDEKNNNLADTSDKNINGNKAKISFKECLKMAFVQFKKSKGKIAFLLVFTIIAISLLSFSLMSLTISNNSIVANTLKNNNMSLGIMEKRSNEQKEILNNDSIDELNKQYSHTSFAAGKVLDIEYTSSTQSSESPFEMKSFKGIIECDDINNLNLNIVCGKSKFDEKSLKKHEIIISDYAAFELRRTGYLGYDASNNYCVNRPNSNEELINTSIKLGNIAYPIVGIFKTNFNEYLELLVSETYVENEDSQSSSLNALKSYYFARIFGPKGFYKQYVNENNVYKNTKVFDITINDVPIYKTDENGVIVEGSYTLGALKYDDFLSFPVFEDVIKESIGKATYRFVYGSKTEKLKDNQVILTYSFFNDLGITTDSQIRMAIKKINSSNCNISKYNDDNISTVIYNKPIEVVGVIDFKMKSQGSILSDNFNRYSMMFSSSFANELSSSLYMFDQILFTLSGSKLNYISKMNAFSKNGYSILNIDGSHFSNSNIEAIKSISMITSIVMTLLAFLIMLSNVTSNIKSRMKEIGILRATGAKGSDVIRIFAVEEGILALFVSLICILITSYICRLTNSILGNANLHIQIVSFDFISIILIILGTAFFFAITTLIPVAKIAAMKPIEAIKKI